MKFSFVDLLAVIVVAAVLLVTTLTAARAAQEMEAVSECADNLRRIGNGIRLYQSENAGQFPRTKYVPGAPVTAYTGVSAADPFAADGPTANDTSAALYLIARYNELPANVFICSAAQRNGLAETWDFTRDTVKRHSNFDARIHSSYSIVNPYPSPAAVAAGYDLAKPPVTLALVGDTNPGDEALGMTVAPEKAKRRDLRMTNSPNHQRDGQNILLADGSVGFYESAFVSLSKDNVYASRGTFPDAGGPDDAVLLPIWKTGPDLVPARTRARRTVFVWASVATFALLTVVVWRGTRRRSATDPAAATWYH